MNVGYLLSAYPILSATFIHREIEQLSKLGWTVHIASINNPDRPFDKLLPEEQAHAAGTFYVKKAGLLGALQALCQELFTHPLGLLNAFCYAVSLGGLHLKELLLYLAYFIEAVMVVHWMRQKGLKHLHVHFASPAASVGMICKKILGCAFSITVHGPDELIDVSKHRLKQKFSAADRIICITNYAQSRIMLHADHSDWHKTRIVRVGLECEPFLKLRQNYTAGSIPQLLSIGRLVPAKGQMILLEAMAELKKRHCKALLTLIGTGPLHANLVLQIQKLGLEEDVKLTGGLNLEQVKAHLGQSDLFVLPSFAEGLPVVLMEALLSKIPCITTYIAGIPELIRHEQDGLLVPASNSVAFADAIERCIQNPDFARQMAESGQQRVLAMHDIEKTVPELSACFSELDR